MNKKSIFWGNSDFINYSNEQVAKFSIPEDAKKFLLEVGLPKDHETFEASNIRFFNASEIQNVIFDDKTYTIIGEMAYNGLAIENETGILYSIPIDEDDGTSSFVNSSIQAFLEFHELFYKELESVGEFKKESDYLQFADNIKAKFLKIDPCALDSVKNVWSEVLEEYENSAI